MSILKLELEHKNLLKNGIIVIYKLLIYYDLNNYNTFEGKKMVKAFMSMVCWHNADTQERYITSKIFSILRLFTSL